jgi:Zn-dependent protease with chaperone function
MTDRKRYPEEKLTNFFSQPICGVPTVTTQNQKTMLTTDASTPALAPRTDALTEALPALCTNGNPVNAKEFIEQGTGSTVALAYVASVFGILIGGVASYGILWLVLLFSPIADYFNRKKTMALLRGSGLQVGPLQFPEIYSCALDYAQRLGMPAVPDIFVIEGNVINAAAAKVGGRKVIILIDDIIDACLRSGEPQTLSFILAHEMAHQALGHTRLGRATLTKFLKKLSRLDEFSCDAVANQLVGNPQISAKALTTMLTGPQLLRYVNLAQLQVQADEVAADKHSIKAERSLSHPLMLRRIKRFC